MVVVANDVEGEGWRLVRPHPESFQDWVTIDSLVPDADWFWHSLQRECVPECCGLAAYDFSAESVAWACGWGGSRPGQNDWRDDNPGDPKELARRLRSTAQDIRRFGAAAVSGSLFNDILTPESYASLFEDLAAKAEPRT